MVSADQEPTRLTDRVARILTEIWRGQVGYVFLPYRAQNGYWGESSTITQWPAENLSELLGALSLNADRYFCPLVFSQPRRRAEFALPTHVLWSDLDEADPRKTRLRPSIACETTGGDFPHYQALWLLDEQIPASDAAALSRRVAYGEPGADHSGWDITQVLRLPETYNFKREPPHQVRILWAERRYYPVAAVGAAYSSVLGDRTTAALIYSASADDIAHARARLPIGLRYALRRPPDGDRSAQLYRLAVALHALHLPSPVIVGLLAASSWNKFRGRSDEARRLSSVVQQAEGLDKRR